MCQLHETLNMLDKVEMFWLQQGVYTTELLDAFKFKDVIITLKNKSLSQTISAKLLFNVKHLI